MINSNIDDYKKITQFKNWTISDIFGHLYLFNIAAIKTLESSFEFDVFFNPILKRLNQGKNLFHLML